MQNKKSVFSWCLYDWANTAFSTVIITFVYGVFFQRGIVGDVEQGSALWAYALGISGMIVAVMSPVAGAIADHYGARKKWLFPFVSIAVAATALLWFGQAGNASAANIGFILTLVVLANVAFEMSIVVSNAMLPDITTPQNIGRVSGWAWGLGYAGGLVCLVLALIGLVGLGDMKPLIPLDQETSAHLRAVGPLVAIWFAVFSVPLFLYTADVPRTGVSFKDAVSRGLSQLKETALHARRYGNLLRFLIASMIYRDGLNTLFAVGGLYAAGTFGMEFQDILIFAIGLNVTAGLGAALFAFADDKLGSKPTIQLSLIGLLIMGAGVLMAGDKNMFMMLALGLGIFMGPVQAASRTMAARLSPPGMVAQTYGLYSLTGKSISFLGPLCFGWATMAFDSQRAGMATILVFWLLGLVILDFVKERGHQDADHKP